MAGEGDAIARLKELNLVPLSISYEYDPCDFLKAKELQQKRDDANFRKSPEDDLINMQTGIYGYKVKFEKYLEGQIAKIDLPNKDIPFLRNKILTMYANPLINYLEAAKG